MGGEERKGLKGMAELLCRMAEARRTVETGILYLSTLRGKGEVGN